MIEIEGSDKSQESKKKKTSKRQPKEHVVQGRNWQTFEIYLK